jgi:hypothetical protein
MATEEFGNYLQYLHIDEKSLTLEVHTPSNTFKVKLPKTFDAATIAEKTFQICSEQGTDYGSTQTVNVHVMKAIGEYRQNLGKDAKTNTSKTVGKIEDDRKESYVQKFSSETTLAEAILIAGHPAFIISHKTSPSKLSILSSIELEDRIIKPLESESYINRPYAFDSREQLDAYIERAKRETIDSLFLKCVAIWQKYIDADNFHILICAADTVFSYFQDKIGMTHYLFFVGNNGSGKSNNLRVFQQLAYRNMFTSDVTSANIYQFLGSIEEGQGTISEDEADNIDCNLDKMKIYKNGYTKGIPVLRTDTNNGRKQYRYYTYCFKAFAGEKLPDPMKAKGFLQRTIELQCFNGFPKYDITEVINPAGEAEYQTLLDELTDTARLLFIYRLLHFHEIIPKIKLNIFGRENQLFSPLIRLFRDSETKKKLLPIISKYVSQKRERNADSFHAYLFKTITDLINVQQTHQLESRLIWTTITDSLPGDPIPSRPQSYQSSDYGEISQREVVQVLKDVFGATASRDCKSRKLVFDADKLNHLGNIYKLDIDIQVLEDTGIANGQSVTHVTLVTLPSIDKQIEEAAGKQDLQDSVSQTLNNLQN